MPEFEGIYPAIATPMLKNGSLNEEAFRSVMEFNINAGVGGFWVAGGNGESVLLSDEENMKIAEIAVSQNKGRVNNIMHVGAPTTARAVALAEHAAKVGVEAIVEHYRVVAAAANLPFFVYNLPNSTGVEITVNLMKKIQEVVPQLVGLKHSSVNFMTIREWSDMKLKCFIGSSMLMLPALTIGAVGCIDGPPCAAPELWVDIWKAWQGKNITVAMTAQEKATRFTMIMREAGVHSATKAVLTERLSIDCGSARLPNPPLKGARRKTVLQAVSNMGIHAIDNPKN